MEPKFYSKLSFPTNQIRVIEDNQKELGESIGEEFAKTMKLTLAGIEKNKKDLEAKLKKY